MVQVEPETNQDLKSLTSWPQNAFPDSMRDECAMRGKYVSTSYHWIASPNWAFKMYNGQLSANPPTSRKMSKGQAHSVGSDLDVLHGIKKCSIRTKFQLVHDILQDSAPRKVKKNVITSSSNRIKIEKPKMARKECHERHWASTFTSSLTSMSQ